MQCVAAVLGLTIALLLAPTAQADPAAQPTPLAIRPQPDARTLDVNATGIFINDAGDVLTARHAVAGCGSLFVIKDARVARARVRVVSPDRDLAVVGSTLRPLLVAAFARTPPGGGAQPVFAAGYDALRKMPDRATAVVNGLTRPGARADALALIERVKRIHLAVEGVAPDGRPYRASDPALLTWVHVAEVSSFLAAHLRYVNPSMPRPEQDRYFAEVALIARLLGAGEVPETCAQVGDYLASMRPELEAGPRTREVVRILRHAAPPDRPLMRPAVSLMFNAGVDLLPAWAQQMLGFSPLARMQAAVARPGVRIVGPFIRWAHVNAVSKRARRRAAAGQEAK